MNESKIIPKFKRKELDFRYLDDGFDDDSTIRLKTIFSAMLGYDLKLELSDIIALHEYLCRISNYADELMSLLTDGEKMDNTFEKHEDFRNEYSPQTKMDFLIFRVYIAVINEWTWVNQILAIMDDYEDEE